MTHILFDSVTYISLKFTFKDVIFFSLRCVKELLTMIMNLCEQPRKAGILSTSNRIPTRG